ncbi:hypothetical protein LR48_Vigan01g145800 [Vigna angularis]|uniref:Uncharacterized protein n=1 Tax=Phaseolus angularis TaxID=3914 RepID=A0A0L9TN59_PHAAN|nr:hypothetical protein LR48_Vigan01g145800 [Vigna angularis]
MVMNLKHVFGEIDGDDVGATAHAAKVEAFDIATELVLVDDHGEKGGCGVEDEDSDVLGFGFLAEAIAEENLALEIEGGWEEVASKGGVVDELLEVDGEVIWGTVAGDVEEVDDGGGAGHDVEDGSVSSHVPRVKKENGEHTWQDVSQLS